MFETPTERSIEGRKEGFLLRFVSSLLMPLLVAIAAHLEFSWIGFSPMDEGWVLGNSRRILAGEVPYRDFVLYQTPGSPFLHVPEVMFGGDYTFWIARLVAWLQIAVIAWAWPTILSKFARRDLDAWHRAVFGLICFAFTASTLPVLIAPALDGLFLISVGLLLALRREKLLKLSGYFLIGFAYLCKQNFAFVFPAVLVLLNDWKAISCWLAALRPGGLFLGQLWVFGALPDAIIQLGSTHVFFLQAAIMHYLLSKRMYLAILIGLSATVLLQHGNSRIRFLANLLIYLILVASAASLSTDLYWYFKYTPFLLFGFSIGAALALFSIGAVSRQKAAAGFLVVVVAWTVSISNGMPSPTLAGGIMVLFLILVLLGEIGELSGYRHSVDMASLGVLILVTLAAFYVGRHEHVYFDLPADKLTARLDGVLPGARLLRTNPNTYAFLSDLDTAISKTHGVRYAIVPGFPVYWVDSPQLNPLPTDWGNRYNLNNPRTVAREVESIAKQQGDIVLLVQKVEPADLREGFLPLKESEYPEPLLSFVRSHFAVVGETRYFELRR